MESSGTLHADDRIQHGFTFRAVLAEFRALRATVLRLNEKSGESDLTDVRRFDEAIDEAMTESMDRFAVRPTCFGNILVKEVAHRVDEDLPRAPPVQRLSELFRNQSEIEALLERVSSPR